MHKEFFLFLALVVHIFSILLDSSIEFKRLKNELHQIFKGQAIPGRTHCDKVYRQAKATHTRQLSSLGCPTRRPWQMRPQTRADPEAADDVADCDEVMTRAQRYEQHQAFQFPLLLLLGKACWVYLARVGFPLLPGQKWTWHRMGNWVLLLRCTSTLPATL